ncbi:MAG TPA: MFS transporter [Gaiellaceae bacterium]|nr:MFS transporter [Gaiellaceae bacterium]
MAALRYRNFRLLFAGRAISFFGTNVVPVALAFAVLDLGSASELGLVLAARTLAQIAALLAGGVLGDRLPRKLVLIGSDSANCAIQLGMGLLLVSGHAEVWQLVVLQLFGGASTAFHSPATSGLVPQTVRAEALQQANAYMTLARYGATILGAAAGGILVATVGSGWAIVLDAGTYAASVALLSQMRLPATARRAEAPHFLRELREGWGAFVEQRWVPISCGWIALYFLFTLAPVFVIGPAIAKESLGGSTAWAVILTGEAIGALLGGVVAIRWRPRRTLVAMGAILGLACLQPALLAGEAAVALIAWAAALTGFGFAFGNVLFETMVQERVRPQQLSRVSAYGWFSAMCCLPLGYALAGPAAEIVGMDAVLWFGAGWMALSSIVFVALPPIRSVRSGDGVVAAAGPAPVSA